MWSNALKFTINFVKQNGVDKQRAKHSILTEAIETTLALIRLLTEEVAEKVSGRSLKEEFSLKKIYTTNKSWLQAKLDAS